MPTRALRTIEQRSESAIEETSRALAVARTEHAAREQLADAFTAELACLRQRIEGARADSQALLTPSDLLWAERAQRALGVRQTNAHAKLLGAQARLVEARAAVGQLERRLRDAELGRRAAAHVLLEHEAQRVRKAEQRAEEAAADSHRAQREQTADKRMP